jgi:arsenate reductase
MNAGHKPLNVLFLCTGNSARSILAESLLNRLGAGKFRAFSAGSMPAGKVNPHAVRLLRKMNFETDHLRSKNWSEFARADNPDAPDLDFVFTVCDNAAGETCPVWPGQPMTAHWGVPDPAAVEGSDAQIALAFADTFRMLNNRIGVFVNLPLSSLDSLTLQKRLSDIGRTKDEAPTKEEAAE